VAKPRIVHRDGIHLFGQRYIAPTLAPYVGERVTVRYDPRDITEIRVFHHDVFLCEAVDEAHAGLTITYTDLQAARNARRRSLRGQINERIAVVAEVLPEHVPGAQRPAAKPPERSPKPRLRTYLED
jgi:putative transposase